MAGTKLIAACFLLFLTSRVASGGDGVVTDVERYDGGAALPKCPPVCIPQYLYGELIAKGLCSIQVFKDVCEVRPCIAYDGETPGFACEEASLTPSPSPNSGVVPGTVEPTPVAITILPSSSDSGDVHPTELEHTAAAEEEEGEEGDMEDVGGVSPEGSIMVEPSPVPSMSSFTTSPMPFASAAPPSPSASVSVPSFSSVSSASPTISFSSSPSFSSAVVQTSSPSRRPAPRDSIPFVIFTDPHIRTFDGLSYDCQASGEFTLLRGTQAGLHIQARFAGPSPRGSVTKALVLRDRSTDTVQVSIPSTRTSLSIELASCPVELIVNGSARAFETDVLGSGLRIFREAEHITIDLLHTGVRVEFRIASSDTFGCYLESLTTHLPRTLAKSSSFVGLAGSPNNMFTDDWMTPYGTNIALPNSTDGLLFGTAYDYCTTNWCIRNASDSLFTYEQNESHATFDKCGEPYGSPVTFGDAVPSDVRALCGENKACLVDGTLGNVNDARRCLQAQAEAEEVTNDAAVLEFEPPVITVGVAVNVLVSVDVMKLTNTVPSELQRFDLFRVDPSTGKVLGEAIISLEDNGEEAFSDASAGDGIFTNLLAVEADYVGQVFGFKAVPVGSGQQLDASPLVITELSGVTSFSTQSGIGQPGTTNDTDTDPPTDSAGDGGSMSFSNADFATYKLAVRYSWGADQEDLDSATQFLTGKVGYDCFPESPFLEFSRDDTGFRGSENVTVSLNEARAQMLWTDSTKVTMSAGWYSPKSGSGPATLRIYMIDATTRLQIAGSGLATVISPGRQSDCAFKLVGTVFIDVGAERTVVRLVKAP